ncbi:MAG TPA: AsmA family protein [Caldimonas sp.]|nr:AsmA family protein [Caldimonas sp.]
MRTPLAAWRAGVRWPLAVVALVATVVVAVLACEAIGWPFLVGPLQHRLESLLDRRVVLGGDAQRASGVRIGLLGSVRVRAASIEIGPPPWGPTPHTLLARDANLKLGYVDLWRAWHGAPLHIADLEAASLDAHLERRADGHASWQFGRKKEQQAEQKEASLPTFGRLAVGDGHVLYVDEVLPAGIDARFALSDGSARGADAAAGPSSAAPSAAGDAASSASAAAAASRPASGGIVIHAGGAAGNGKVAESVRLAAGESGLRLKAVGQYRQLPVRIDLATAGVLGFLGEGAEARAQPLSLRAVIGRAQLSFDGTTLDPLHFTALKGRFKLAGPSLAAVGDPLGITLPTTPPFDTHGTLVKDGSLWKAVFDSASIGSSRLAGAFTYDKRPKVPLLAGRLTGSRVLLADLGPTIGAPAPGSGEAGSSAASGGRVIPDKKFDLPSLRAMDANILIQVGVFDPGTDLLDPLHDTRAHLLLADGVLTVADFEGTTAQGKLAGYLQLDGRGKEALWTADMRLLGVDLAQWLRLKRKGDAPPYLAGKLDALVKVKGSGRSAAEILASLDGDLRMHMRNAAVSHVAVEAAGLDLAQALGVMIKGDDALPIQCNVADLDIVKGIARPKVFVVNTRDSTIWIDGTVSFRDESLDLRFVVSPKDFSPLTLRTPVHVRGTLGKPAVSLELGKLAGKAGAAGLLALLNPLAAIIPFIDPGSKRDAAQSDNECAALARTSGVIPSPVRHPKATHVPPAAAAGSAASAASAAQRPAAASPTAAVANR